MFFWLKVEGEWTIGRILINSKEKSRLFNVLSGGGMRWEDEIDEIGPQILPPKEAERV